MHEQSETVQGPDGRWMNVYGRRTPQAGQQLPDTSSYGTVDEAVAAAKARSAAFPHEHALERQRGMANELRRK